MAIYSAKLKNVIHGTKQKYFLIEVNRNGEPEQRLYLADIEKDNLMSKPIGTAEAEITNIANVYDWSNQAMVHNMFDILDPYSIINCRGYALKNKSDLNENDAESYSDIYAPPIFNTLGIIQIGDFMYTLTDKMSVGCWYTVNDVQNISNDDNHPIFEKTVNRVQDTIHTAIYNPVSEMIEVSDDYARFAEKYIPKYIIDGLEYNHILEFPTSLYAMFKDSTVLANTLIGKNHLGYDYSQHAEIDGGAFRIPEMRTYVRIGSCAGNAYLVYKNDTVAYTSDFASAPSSEVKNRPIELSAARIENDPSVSSNIVKDGITTKEYAKRYERVESIASINRYSAKAIHKSNLYSIELTDTGLNTAFASLGEAREKTIATIKKSVKNGIRALCEKIQPGNTQLFEVYFKGF